MKKLLSIILTLTMVLSFATAFPISAAEIESKPVVPVGQDELEPHIDEEIGDDESSDEWEEVEEVENDEALGERESNDAIAVPINSLQEITFISHSNRDSVEYKSIKVQWLSVGGAESYRFYGKILDGEPNPGDNEPGEMIYDKTVTKRYVTMSKSDIVPGKWIKVYVAAFNSSEAQIAGGTLYLFVNNVELATPEFSSHNDRDTVELSATDEDFKVSWYKVTNAEGYRVIAKALSGTPNPSDNEAGTVLIDKDTTSKYIYINKSDLHSRQWVKIWLEAYNETLGISSNNYIYLYVVFDDAQSPSLTLSENYASLDWNDTTKDYVTVSESGFSYQIEYPKSVVDSAGDFDYEWIECSQSGSKLYFKATRPNYSDKSRSVEITVEYFGETATLTVEQDACGEGAPTLKLKRGSTYLNDGADIGTFTLPQERMEVSVEANHIRKLTANLSPVSGSTILQSTSLNMISFDISNFSAGDYKIVVYGSNSDYTNDYWAQRPFSSMTLYFSLTVGGGSVGTGSADNLVAIAMSEVGYKEGAGNNTKYGKFTGTNGYAWCAPFVSWCANEAKLVGNGKLFVGKTGTFAKPYSIQKDYKFEVWYFYLNNNGGTPYTSPTDLSWKTDENRVHNATGYYDSTSQKPSEGDRYICTPQKGDLIFFRPSKGTDRWGHVGIVTEYKNGMVYYIDGNGSVYSGGSVLEGPTQDGVSYRTVPYSNTLICAITRPDYDMTSPEPPAPHTHTWDGGAVTRQPTCTDTGEKTFTCTGCGEKRIETIPAKGHTPGAAANCTTPQTCTVCGAQLAAALGHNYAGTYYDDAHPHAEYQLCTRCGDRKDTGNTRKDNNCPICNPPTPHTHTWDGGAVTKQPTCTETGEKTFTCTGCGEQRIETIPAKGHTPGAAANCTTPQTCTACGAQLAAALGHNYAGTYYDDAHPHAEYQLCTRCGDRKDTGKTRKDNNCPICNPPTPHTHTWDGGAVTKQPTCTAAGEKTYTCTGCGEQRIETIPAKGHTPGAAANCTTPQTCTVCGTQLAAALGHNYAGTYYDDAHPHAEYQLCTRCGDRKDTGKTRKDNNCPICNPSNPDPEPSGGRIVVGNICGSPGSIVDLSVYLEGAPKINLLMIHDISYDNTKVELISAKWLEKGTDGFDYNESPDPLDKDVMCRIHDNDIDMNGLVATIRLRIKDNIDSCDTVVNLQSEALDAKNRLQIAVSAGTVTISNVIRGDFNNDGVLNAADSVYLKKHIALPSRYPLSQSGDINGDGVVNSQDAIYLKKHIALPSRYPLH